MIKIEFNIIVDDENYSDLVSLYAAFEKELISIGYKAEDITNYYKMHFGISIEELEKVKKDVRGY